MRVIKIVICLILFSLNSFAQQWYSMGDIDTTPNSNSYRGIKKIIFYNNKITIGGYFKNTNTKTLNSMAQWNGNVWEPMGIGLWYIGTDDSAGACHELIEYRSKLYIGGVFQGAGGNAIGQTSHKAGNIAKWNGTDWYPLTQPTDGVNNTCTALGVYNDNLYLGGSFGNSFDSSGVQTTRGIAKWNDTVFSATGQLSSSHLLSEFNVMDFTVYNNKLIAGGLFNSINGSPYGSYGFIASWNDTIWDSLASGFNDFVHTLTVYNGELYAGGNFTATGNNATALNHVAKWDGLQWLPVGEGLNDSVLVLYVDTLQNKLYAGGKFTQTGLGQPAKHLAEWNGTNWVEVGGGTNDIVFTLFAKDSNLYVGGAFTQAGGITANLIAVWGNHPVGINEIVRNNRNIKIFPNPSNGNMQLNYELGEEEIGIVNITDIAGKLVASYNLENNKNNLQIKVDGLNNGVYLYQIIINGTIVNADKLVIIKD